MKTFFARYKVRPNPSDEKYAQYSGAYVCVWVVHGNQSHAQNRAERLIKGDGWDIESMMDIRIVKRKDHKQKPVLLALFEKAQSDGIAATFDVFTSGGRQFN